ncbi:inhibitor of nuclear factor kappa-B kinase subunit epsilon-like [Sitodiplosis mosellana]|uniref:inhibitor of nuclear factor kappa-B kinase subunit epsilon-like n=1 Tax=Sitodiplosis mosellana TaxID=263140 RepID=UPI0024452813|nr:inhibitor of nuclear factor kappa-B kinase subunit epsilon-like [Sitodiplosis mosellana]
MRECDHENVVKLFDLQEIKGVMSEQKVLVMEYCDCSNLQNLIDLKPLGLDAIDFLHFFQHLTSAIKHLHDRNIVHRDVKPDNSLLAHHEGQIIFKLADFGAARFLKPHESYGSLYGTFEYLHPDIFAKFYAHDLNFLPPKQAFNYNHELWSLGVTIFEAATGHLPFEPKEGRTNPKKMYHMIADSCAIFVS